MEKILETRNCSVCDISFDISDKDLEFYKKVSPIIGGKKFEIPKPTLCPSCRHTRRICWRNERKLYRRKCDFSGNDILSIISPDKPYKVYAQEIWHGDARDAFDYGRDFDFKRGFFEQFHELMLDVPQIDRYLIECHDSDYTHGVGSLKSCYMCFNVDHLENCIYCTTSNDSKLCVDCSFLNKCENCYDSINLINCFETNYSYNCEDCNYCYFISDCKNCSDCFLCSNLVNKKYFIQNEEYSKEDYKTKKEELLLKDANYLKGELDKLSQDLPKRYRVSKNTENSTGDYINNVKDSEFVFDCNEIEDCKYCRYVFNAKNCMDYDIYGDNSELVYESIMTGTDIHKSLFCACNWVGGSDNIYCNLLFGCKNCFGCVGLKNKQYCIFNKQYSKEDYEKEVSKIIEHMKSPLAPLIKRGVEWGEFFPFYLSPFGYNETVAQDEYPISKEKALELGLNWSDYESPVQKVEKTIPGSKLPNNISSIPDDILNWAIKCEETGKPFRIIKAELEFYRKRDIQIPSLHWEQRYAKRMRHKNKRKLFERHCDKCNKDILTSYEPGNPDSIYCEECYNKEIY